jgi:hypothetical protein
LRDVAADVSTTVAFLGAVATAAVGYGVMSLAQVDAVTALLGLVPGFAAAVTAVVAATRTARKGEALVTPNTDPAMVDEYSRELVRLVPARPGTVPADPPPPLIR